MSNAHESSFDERTRTHENMVIDDNKSIHVFIYFAPLISNSYSGP